MRVRLRTHNGPGEKDQVGLRERKKEQLRTDLAAAAVGLFIERGYEATKVQDIAAAVDVSPRTFFRYYPAKDDVVVELLRIGVIDLRDELAQRPGAEPLPAALRASVHHWIDDAARSAANLLLVTSLLRRNPLLLGRVEEARRRAAPAIVEIVAQRLGTDPALDPRPRVIVTLVLSVVGCAIERWSEDGGTGPLGGYVDAGLDLLEYGLPSEPDAGIARAGHDDSARRTSRLSVVTPSTPKSRS